MRGISTAIRVALLIDAENVHTNYPSMVRYAESCGSLTKKRAYGDWTNPSLSSRKQTIQSLNIKLMHQVSGRNATDQRMSKEADDLLQAGKADLFIIASNDHYYLPLATRIRNAGKHVIIIGNRTISKRYRKAGFEVICVENLL